MMPARQSMIPEIVSPARLMNAVALSAAGTNIMRLAGPPVGGLLLVAMGPGWVYVTMALLYALGAVAMLPVTSRAEFKADKDLRNAGKTTSMKSRREEFIEGCKYIGRDRVIF